jgi:hypothetical protein
MDPNVVSGTATTLTGIGKDEAWLREWFRDRPDRLGLGELGSASEAADAAAGDGDSTFLVSDEQRCFSVAVRLGELAAAQAFDALHAWARGRASRPDKAHVAVLVTETVGDRYRGTLEALAEHLPLVVIELAVWRGEAEAIVVPHVALAAGSVDLSAAPATASAAVLGAMRAATITAEGEPAAPSGVGEAPATVSDSTAGDGVEEVDRQPEVVAGGAEAQDGADDDAMGVDSVTPPQDRDNTGIDNPWRLLRHADADPVQETALTGAAR